ncbi:uncharacterized protein LOC119736246 [Patiria miniata]|uniref:Uncharacterized protein n=1 Tax=Patiria miniata TaxID=46514 RepID=A0A914ARD1_PATMI|nr:uncharacterized protein LOC119736246 [Patiria miniata]
MELGAGSRFFLKNPESGFKIKIEMPKDGIFKRIRKSFVKRGKSTTEGFEPPNQPPPVPPRRHGANQEPEENEYQPLVFKERNREPMAGNEVPQREPARIPESEMALNLDEDIYLPPESYDRQVYVNEDLFPGPPKGQKRAKQLPRRGSQNPPDVPRRLRPVSDGHAYVQVADGDYAPMSGRDRNVDAPPSPGSNTEYDSQREDSFGDDIDEAYKRLRQDYENAKLDSDCPTTPQKVAPLPTVNHDANPRVPVPDYWIP